eukprot:TRINITY_DN2107_c0_g1_i1.p1 TRINITY_DN2107_c0_g1~~TRINITY_DN2107_c0_g1_i1.p1  ORF type:complete len:390 (-),score=33.71 TRINITY_DN2107_c0_g1_i1:822-1991(-)
MDTSGEYYATSQAAPLSGITLARVRSVRPPRFVKAILFAAVAVATLVVVDQIQDHAVRRSNARTWLSYGSGYSTRSMLDRRWYHNMDGSIGGMESAMAHNVNGDGAWRVTAVPAWLRRMGTHSWAARAVQVELSPQLPLTYDSSAGTGHCDYGFSCRVHLYITETANDSIVMVGYQIKALFASVLVPGPTQTRIAQMADTQAASLAHELVTHVSQELEQPVCGVDVQLVKQVIKETAAQVLQNCQLTTDTEACYPQREVLRFPSASLQKTYMLPTRQCSARRYCRALLEVQSVNNCVSSSAGYKIFSVNDEVQTVDKRTKRRVGGTSRSLACSWANKLLSNVEKDFGDLGCALDDEAVCDGMLAGAKQVASCTHTDKAECLSVSAVGCV